MATFSYLATDRSGRKQRGTITAASSRLARDQLRSRGLQVQSVKDAVAHKTGQTWSWPFRRRYRNQLTLLTRELATLLQVGVPLLESLETLSQTTRGHLHVALLSIRDRISVGESLAVAMSQHTDIFDEMTIGMVRVGEHAGNLDSVLHHVADFHERAGELRNRLQSAMLYPAIVLCVSVIVAIFLMTVVVPMLLTSLVEMGRPLPWPTMVLKTTSDLLLRHGWWFAVLVSMLAIGLGSYLSTPSGQRAWNRILLRSPLFGMLSQRQSISQMALIVTSLLRSGVTLVESLRICNTASSNILVRDALAEIAANLEEGKDLGATIEKHAIFPATVAQVFVLGQRSGELDVMLERLGVDYDRQAQTISHRVAAAIEPALIVVLAVFVGFILFATVLPILEAGNVLEDPST